MKRIVLLFAVLAFIGGRGSLASAVENMAPPSAGQALQLLKGGNARFFAGKSLHANDMGRANLAGKPDAAFATIIACPDVRVPVERIFDAGSSDLFIVRVVGNLTAGAKVEAFHNGRATPLLVVLGHSQCSALKPALKRAQQKNPALQGEALVAFATEENVWQEIADLFMTNPATRAQVKSGKTKVVGALYDAASGKVQWLAESRVAEILAQVEKAPKKASEAPGKAGYAVAQGY